MNISFRRRYILQATFAYALMALSWIFLSDQLIAVFINVQSLIWLSTVKGVFFVLVSAAAFSVALNAVPPETKTPLQPADMTLPDTLAVDPWPRWLTYGFAIALVLTTLLVRLHLPLPIETRPLMFLFLLPVIVAALSGGFGPGLVATIAAALIVISYLIPQSNNFSSAGHYDIFQLALLIVSGVTVSIISETMRQSRRRELARLHQLKAANAALRQSEDRFHRLFDAAPVAMVLTDAAGTFLARNERLEQLFGYTAGEVSSFADWWPLAFPDPDYRLQARESWAAAVNQATRTGKTSLGGEYRVTCRNGSECLARMYTIGMSEGLLTAFLDETERHHAEERLRLWGESFEQAHLGLIITDARNNTIIAANPAFARQRGYECGQMDGMPLARLLPAGSEAEIKTILSSLKTTTHGVFETRHITRDGRIFPVLMDVTVLLDKNNQPLHRVAYVLDISERKRADQALDAALEKQKQRRVAALNLMQDANAARANAEQALAALRESKERLKLFIDHAPASLAMFDREMRYLAVSRRWMDDFNLGDSDITGRSHYTIFPEIGEKWKAVHRRGLAGEVIRAGEDRFERANGTVQWLRWEVRPWRTATGAIGGIVIFSEDVTRSRQAEEEIRSLNAGLECRVAERTAELTAANQELDSFAYAVSHDLRAPLRAMNGFSQALIEDFGHSLHGDARIYLDQIIIGSRKMGELIDGLLTLSRSTRGALQRDTVNLSVMAKQLLDAMAREESGREVRLEIEPDLTVRGDAAMLEVVMHNVLANAWKYTSRREQAVIRVFSRMEEANRFVCIADNGAGFEAAHAGKLFQPFQRLHRQEEFSGLGIGLATVQRIIHRHGGELFASGEKDKGATFCFSLPLHEGRNNEVP